MTQLSELNNAINALNDLWPLLEGDEQEGILNERDVLNKEAAKLAHATLVDGTPELSDAITDLNETTQAAKDAKASIDVVVQRIVKVQETITKASKAAGKVSKLISILA